MGENQGSIIWLGMSSRILQTTVQVHFRQYQSDFCIMVTLCYPGNHFTAFLKIFLGYNQQFEFFSFRVKQKIGKKRRIKRFKNSRDSLRFFRHCEIFQSNVKKLLSKTKIPHRFFALNLISDSLGSRQSVFIIKTWVFKKWFRAMLVFSLVPPPPQNNYISFSQLGKPSMTFFHGFVDTKY